MKSLRLLFISAVLLLYSCEKDAPFVMSSETIVELTSPNRCCVVTVSETQMQNNQFTGISFDFTEYGGGFSAVAFDGIGHDLELRWIDSENLEIRYPKELPIYGTADVRTEGDIKIGRVKFYKRTVNIHFVPKRASGDA